MKTYSHDYTKPAEAAKLIWDALQAHRREDAFHAEDNMQHARNILDSYLGGDNMVEDDDVADGWVKQSEAGAYMCDVIYHRLTGRAIACAELMNSISRNAASNIVMKKIAEQHARDIEVKLSQLALCLDEILKLQNS